MSAPDEDLRRASRYPFTLINAANTLLDSQDFDAAFLHLNSIETGRVLPPQQTVLEILVLALDIKSCGIPDKAFASQRHRRLNPHATSPQSLALLARDQLRAWIEHDGHALLRAIPPQLRYQSKKAYKEPRWSGLSGQSDSKLTTKAWQLHDCTNIWEILTGEPFSRRPPKGQAILPDAWEVLDILVAAWEADRLRGDASAQSTPYSQRFADQMRKLSSQSKLDQAISVVVSPYRNSAFHVEDANMDVAERRQVALRLLDLLIDVAVARSSIGVPRLARELAEPLRKVTYDALHAFFDSSVPCWQRHPRARVAFLQAYITATSITRYEPIVAPLAVNGTAPNSPADAQIVLPTVKSALVSLIACPLAADDDEEGGSDREDKIQDIANGGEEAADDSDEEVAVSLGRSETPKVETRSDALAKHALVRIQLLQFYREHDPDGLRGAVADGTYNRAVQAAGMLPVDESERVATSTRWKAIQRQLGRLPEGLL